MGFESEPKQEVRKERLGYKEALEKTEQLMRDGFDVQNAMKYNVLEGKLPAMEARQRAYKWRDAMSDFVNNERPSTNPDVFLKQGVSYADADRLTHLEAMDGNILIEFMNMQRSLDEKSAN